MFNINRTLSFVAMVLSMPLGILISAQVDDSGLHVIANAATAESHNRQIVPIEAFMQADPQSARHLLQKGAQKLHLACTSHGIGDVLRWFAFADELYRRGGATPLHIAAQYNRVDLARFLVENRLYHVDCKTGGAFVSEDKNRFMENIKRYEIRTEAEWNRVKYLANNVKWAWVQEVLPVPFKLSQALYAFNLSRFAQYTFSPLYIACRYGHYDMVCFLLASGADVNDISAGKTPLYVACLRGDERIARKLIEYGADLNQAKGDGATPLFKACQNGHLNIVKLLCESGADKEKSKLDGARPLNAAIYAASHAAMRSGHLDVTHYLIQHGANLNATYAGKTAREWYVSYKLAS